MDFLLDILRGMFGIVVLLGICYVLSSNRKAVNWRLIIIGVLLQVLLAFLLLKVPFVRAIFQWIVDFFVIMIGASDRSARFLFGNLADASAGFGFAFAVLPTVVFFSALSSILYYFGILQKVVYGFAWIMTKTMKLSGAESLAAAANVFIGQTEAPLVVKPYLEKMSSSEIMSLMTGGMATIAGGVFGAYMSMLGGNNPQELASFGMHLLTASIISAPAAIVAAKLLVPETNEDVSMVLDVSKDEVGVNFLDALSRGTTDGLKLAVNVGAMLLAFMAMVYLVNEILSRFGAVINLNDLIASTTEGTFKELSLQYIMGLFFAPIAWLIGVASTDLLMIGQTLGEKTILNEFVAYASLVEYKNAGVLQPKSLIIATYALCGFANFASIGIQIGGISAIAPGQRNNLVKLGMKALIGGTIATLITGAIAGIMFHF